MLERLHTDDSVLGLCVSGHISDADIEQAIVLMDRGLARNPTLHVFAELRDLSGVDPSGIMSGWINGAHLLTQLRRFGRVAIVSEKKWMRAVARVESAVLPGVSYRVFEPAGREEAFAWVCGT